MSRLELYARLAVFAVIFGLLTVAVWPDKPLSPPVYSNAPSTSASSTTGYNGMPSTWTPPSVAKDWGVPIEQDIYAEIAGSRQEQRQELEACYYGELDSLEILAPEECEDLLVDYADEIESLFSAGEEEND